MLQAPHAVAIARGLQQWINNDQRCKGASYTSCQGATAPSGTRFAVNCIAGSEDCDDQNSALYNAVDVRQDQDTDSYCVGASVSRCFGAAVTYPCRATSSCQAINDCSDANSQANTTCYISGAYSTNSTSKGCGVGPAPCQNVGVSVASQCPIGFASTNLSTQVNSPANCAVVNGSPTLVNACCGGLVFGTVSCRIVGDCEAQ